MAKKIKVKKPNWIGQTVLLKASFLHGANKQDECVSVKKWRPYLVITILMGKEKKLFALPNYSALCGKVDKPFRTVFSPRFKTPSGRKHALVYSSMMPISESVIHKKFYEIGNVPIIEGDRKIGLENIKSWRSGNIPEKARNEFMAMQSLCAPQKQENGLYKEVGIEVFDIPEFQAAYKKVDRAMFKNYIVEVSKNLQQVMEKAQKYYDDYYVPYSNGENVKMPKHKTDIKLLYELVDPSSSKTDDSKKSDDCD